MPKYYQTKEFRDLNTEWRKKLELDEFPDIEDENENLKKQDLRTQSYDNRDKIHDFFRKLDSYLSSTKGIPRMHKMALNRYSKGKSFSAIATDMGISKSYVGQIIKKYKEKILSIPV